jgi:phage head maturation protease
MASNRIILSTEHLNSYGFRIMTSGIDLSRFASNPVMLYNHWELAGKWEDVKIEDGKLSGSPVFIPNHSKSEEVKAAWEGGFLNAASVGFHILETSEDPALMLPGQKYPTVTKAVLMEASLVDVPANAHAVRLYDASGEKINLADEQAITLAFSQTSINRQQPMSKPEANFFQKMADLLQGYLSAGNQAPPAEPAEPAPSPAPAPAQPEAATEALSAQLAAAVQQLKDQHNTILSLQAQLASQHKVLTGLKDLAVQLALEPAATPAPPAAAGSDQAPSANHHEFTLRAIQELRNRGINASL